MSFENLLVLQPSLEVQNLDEVGGEFLRGDPLQRSLHHHLLGHASLQHASPAWGAMDWRPARPWADHQFTVQLTTIGRFDTKKHAGPPTIELQYLQRNR